MEEDRIPPYRLCLPKEGYKTTMTPIMEAKSKGDCRIYDEVLLKKMRDLEKIEDDNMENCNFIPRQGINFLILHENK